MIDNIVWGDGGNLDQTILQSLFPWRTRKIHVSFFHVVSFRCLCPPGYSGQFCEVILDPCLGHGCSDHGFCMGSVRNYTCRCSRGYEGPFCEVEADECLSSPCKNGATCLDLIGHFSCQCATGFKGKFQHSPFIWHIS